MLTFIFLYGMASSTAFAQKQELITLKLNQYLNAGSDLNKEGKKAIIDNAALFKNDPNIPSKDIFLSSSANNKYGKLYNQIRDLLISNGYTIRGGISTNSNLDDEDSKVISIGKSRVGYVEITIGVPGK